MLLVHQTGTVKVGEVVRYTLTYTPSADRILPTPPTLRLRIKNTAAVPLRAAYLHGPYTLHVSAYPSNFNPNRKLESPRQYGLPEYEPQLKAGGSWDAQLRIPDEIRETGETGVIKKETSGSANSVTWLIDITSQIIFSSSATVPFEVLVARDETSLTTDFVRVAERSPGSARRIEDHQQDRDRRSEHHTRRPKGVFSKAVKLVIDDTTSLWNKPPWPNWEGGEGKESQIKFDDPSKDEALNSEKGQEQGLNGKRKPKRVHLVILTHGLHSNLSADLLYLKESIDATAREAREAARKRRAKQKEERNLEQQSLHEHEKNSPNEDPAKSSPVRSTERETNDEESDEEVIVRGFTENVIRTERGIKYLGKRLARYILRMTYPQQPFLPAGKPVPRTFTSTFGSRSLNSTNDGRPAHPHSSLYEQSTSGEKLPYEITSISFIGHSLGGLVQTYAIAYIQKHSPHFFEIIKPINFIALATPFLGLSNENPLYVKFALDFGLVGRTGQDLGLVWRAPAMTRTGLGAFIAGLGVGGAQKPKATLEDPGSKPLLRILPTGPAHVALKRFRNRTVYANVVNDGIVPLRTSCLLFLDWSSLGRVEKARRENGLVGMMEWGWAELTGSKLVSRQERSDWQDAEHADKHNKESDNSRQQADGEGVLQPSADAAKDNTPQDLGEPEPHRFLGNHAETGKGGEEERSSSPEFLNTLNNFLTIFLPNREKSQRQPAKISKVYKRSQTIHGNQAVTGSEDVSFNGAPSPDPNQAAASVSKGEESDSLRAPPTTSIFESAGALLNPPIPPTEFLIDPSSRPRTIFHDRVYHPSDIPPMPVKKRSTFIRSLSGSREGSSTSKSGESLLENPKSNAESGGMTVEEKIARAYHRDMSWRKVLVRLEPDAHNNIIVRRMFANAYGWPVVKHLVDTHFADTDAASTRDDEDAGIEHAKGMDQGVGEDGEEVDHGAGPKSERDLGNIEEGEDKVGELGSWNQSASSNKPPGISRQDSVQWSEADFEVTDDEDDMDMPSSSKGTRNTNPTDSLGASPKSDVHVEDATHVGLRNSFDQQHEDGVMAQVVKLAASNHQM